MSMSEEKCEAALEEIQEAIDESDAMDPDLASHEQSIEFLEGIVDHCGMRINAIRHDMEENEG